MKKINRLSALLFLIATLSITGCGVFGKSNGTRGCGCPGVYKKPVG